MYWLGTSVADLSPETPLETPLRNRPVFEPNMGQSAPDVRIHGTSWQTPINTFGCANPRIVDEGLRAVDHMEYGEILCIARFQLAERRSGRRVGTIHGSDPGAHHKPCGAALFPLGSESPKGRAFLT